MVDERKDMVPLRLEIMFGFLHIAVFLQTLEYRITA